MAPVTSISEPVFEYVDGFGFLEGLELDFSQEHDEDELTRISDVLLRSKAKSNLCPTLKWISIQGQKTCFKPL
jgi:hypothetical protein